MHVAMWNVNLLQSARNNHNLPHLASLLAQSEAYIQHSLQENLRRSTVRAGPIIQQHQNGNLWTYTTCTPFPHQTIKSLYILKLKGCIPVL